MQTRNFSYNLLRVTKEMPCVCVRGHFGSTIFHLYAVVHFYIYTLLSLKYYAPDTRSSVNIYHIILTLTRTSDAMQGK